MARKELVSPDPEDLRKDLLATLAAGRELGPEMDSALVDAHLRRHFGDTPQRAVQPRRPAAPSPLVAQTLLPTFMIMLGVAAFVAIVVATKGMGWWLFWPLMLWGWGWGGRRRWGYGGHRRYDRRWDRYSPRSYGRDGHDGQDGDGYVSYQGSDNRPDTNTVHEVV
jgi:hypothetical protein